jgi:hypothetical protein
MSFRKLTIVTVLLIASVVSLVFSFTLNADPSSAQVDQSQSVVQKNPQTDLDTHHDLSPPLFMIPPARRHSGLMVRDHERLPRPHHRATTDPVLQRTAATAAAPSTTTNFDGIGNGVAGFTVNSAPPDTNGDVGPNHYVQIVNTDFAVYNKSGTLLYGPNPINTLWSGFGGGCQTNDDGDPVVVYDRISDRWIISQFSVSTTPYLQCVAVSQTNDPTGAYYRYSFSYGNSDFPDYPKMGVWPDAYYETFNIFGNGGNTFSGARVCAYDRTKMLSGQAATQQCFNTSTTYGGILPSHLTGPTLPPAGSPNYVLGLGATSTTLAFWKFHVDWTTPANSTFTGPTALTVASYTEACGSSGTCIPQSGTAQQLDSLSDRLMYRLAYRNFGNRESLVVNHSVTAGSSVGVRWYELRSPGTTPTIFQQGTYAPDSNYRWMGSIVMDQSGNMALGYSTSSSSLHPQINYTGRLSTSPAGVMDQGEGTIINGAGSQTGSNLSRWGDYSSMSIDPSDDCTFWYTNEYIPSNGAFNWKTRIGSFKFSTCGAPAGDFSISASPTNINIQQGSSGTSTISTAVTSGSAGTVNLSASVSPAGPTASLNPTSVTAGGSSTLTVNVGSSVAPGNYTVTVTGTEGSNTHTTTVTVTVTAAPADFTISANPSSLTVLQNSSGTSTISTTQVGSAGTVSLSASVSPAGPTVSVSPTSVSAGGASTLTVNAGSAATGNYTVTVTGTEGSTSHSTTVALTITTVVVNDFSISASPNSVSIAQGSSGTSTVSTAVTSGNAGSVSLSASVSPAGPTASLNPTAVTAGGSATLTVSVGSSVATGVYTVTVTGTEGSATHGTNVAVTVTAASSGIVNGGFETGTLSGWTSAGTTGVVTGGHSGTYAARLGSTNPTNGDSSITQTFTAPAGSNQLTFWYKMTCPDTVTYDWATATLKDNTTGTTTTILPKVCATNSTWVQDSATITAGHSYTLTLISHDDNYAGDPTYTLFDDVATGTASSGGGNAIVNGGFEAGSLTGWTSAGTTSVVTGGHSGTYAARAGSTNPTNGDSSISQTFTAPAGTTKVSFWYKNICPDTLTYDWATATLRDNTAGTTTTILQKVCTNNNTWVQDSATITAGHSYTLTLVSHDDNYAGDATYTLFDDVITQ